MRLPSTLLRHCCLVILFVITIARARAQVSFFLNESAVSVSETALSFYTDSSKDHSWQRFKSIEKNLVHYPSNNFYISYQNKQVWIRLQLNKLQDPDQLKYLMIRNPHINYLNVWLLKDDKLVKAFTPTGDRIKFSSRPVTFSDFLFPLPEDSLEHYSLIILADKRNELFNIPIQLLSESGLLHYIRVKNWTAGLFIGISFFLILFNFFLYLNMRDRLYIYYGIYIFLGFLYIFSDMGFTFMYLFPDNPLLSDFTRPISVTLATPIYLLFSMELLETRNYFPLNYKWMLRLLIGYVLLIVASLPLAADTGIIRVILSGISYVVLNLLLIANLLIGWKSYRKKIPYALYIIVASLILITLLFLFTLFLSGNLPDTFFNRNMMRIGIATEIGILILILAHRFKKYKVASETLLRKVNEQQEQIFNTVSDYQEKELQRLSSMLHDSIGARLSALRFNLESAGNGPEEKTQITKVVDEINALAIEVRRFSHDLSPALLQKNGLEFAVTRFLHPILETGKLAVQFEMIGSQHRIPLRYELLVFNLIQELVQNIIKHANASEAIIQLILEEGLVSIYAEDNGIGFNKEKIKEGLGFLQFKQMIKFVNGSMQIDAAEGEGSRISIEFTTLPDDAKYPDTHSR